MAETAAQDLERIVADYGDKLFRVCLLTLGNHADAEDAMQETLLKYLYRKPVFRDGEHEKAWLLRVAVNQSRDLLRARSRREKYERESALTLSGGAGESDGGPLLEALYALPEKFKTVLLLHDVEEYKVAEVANLLGISASAVKMRLQKGRRLLKEAYQRGKDT
ncbi:MAG: RNA polymerase sigma factor [Oscillospiraceae bacterium]|nr:RNA polymerase sigma factor [Oscillospiraceae bacterium]